MFPSFAAYWSRSTRWRVTRSGTWECSARSRALSGAMTLESPPPLMSARWPVEQVARGVATSRWMFAPLRSSGSWISSNVRSRQVRGPASTPRWARTAGRSGSARGKRVTRNVKCPFLNEGRCTVYETRPPVVPQTITRRVWPGAVNLTKSPKISTSTRISPGVYQAGGAHVEAFCTAMREAGYDVNAYELNYAFDAALSEPRRTGAFRIPG